METKVERRKRTKIVATIGPASQDIGMLRAMIRAGWTWRGSTSVMANTRFTREISPISGMWPTKKTRSWRLWPISRAETAAGHSDQDPVEVTEGDLLTLTLRTKLDPEKPFEIPMPHPDVLRDLKLGDRLLVDDGQLEFVVQGKQGSDVTVEVVTAGRYIRARGKPARYGADAVIDHRAGPRKRAVRLGAGR